MTERWATFDCYGTLIDWERGISDAFAGLWPQADTAQLLAAYHEIEPQVQRSSSKPYRAVLAEALTAIARNRHLELDDPDALSATLPEWPPFSEVPDELRELRGRGWLIAILSNTDPDLLDASVKRIGVDVDLRITFADTGTYKPAPGHWERFFNTTDADPAGHAHVAASLFHDIEPATAQGLRCVWINREGERTELEPAAELPTLAGLADTLDGLVVA